MSKEMTPAEKKLKFVELRAQGLSYEKIANELHISKSTCSEWEAILKKEIAQLKQEQLNELYESYYMTKEARITKLGDTLLDIEGALADADLSEISGDRLLDYQLKYTEALKDEYIGKAPAYKVDDRELKAEDIVKAYADLLNRVQAGEVTDQQARRESVVLSSLLKAYNLVELEERLDALEDIVGGRT